jgi:hypothetical protein
MVGESMEALADHKKNSEQNKYGVEQNDCHLVTFAITLVKIRKKRRPNLKIYIQIPNVIYCEGIT